MSTLAPPALPDPQLERRAAARRDRYRLRFAANRLSRLPSVQACGRSVRTDAGAAQLLLGADGVGGLAGLNQCSSVSACPCCSARIRQARAGQIEAAGLAQLRAGGALAFATYTMPHKKHHTLAELLAAEKAAWKALREDKSVRAFLKAFGGRFVRAVEVTFTAGEIGGNGWHPHLHVLWLFELPPSATELEEFFRLTTAAWAGSIERAGYGRPDQFDLQLVDGRVGTRGLVQYLTKVQDNLGRGSWGVGAEMVRGDLKRGRKRSRTPFELLASAAGLAVDNTGTRRRPSRTDLERWHEYEAATKGLRVIEASRGLFAALAVDDVLDEQAPEAAPDAQLVALIGYDDFALIARYRKTSALVDIAERGGGQRDVDEMVRALRRRDVFEQRRRLLRQARAGCRSRPR